MALRRRVGVEGVLPGVELTVPVPTTEPQMAVAAFAVCGWKKMMSDNKNPAAA